MAEKSLIMLKKENGDLLKENHGLKETVTTLLQEVERLRELHTIVPTNSAIKIAKTREQQIIEDQIAQFELRAKTTVLDLDDIRALDILIKNKRLLEKEAPLEGEFEDQTEKLPEDELLRLAGDVEDSKFRKRTKSKASKKDSVE